MAEILYPGLFEFGVVVKAHGMRGGLLIEVEDPDIPSDQVEVVYLRSSDKQWVPYRINEMRSQNDRKRNLFFVLLEGIESRTIAESLRGQTVMSDHDFTTDVPEVSLVGFQVIREDGSVLGEISDSMQTPAYEVFVVQAESKQVLIPDVDEFVSSVETKAGKIFVRNTAELESLE